MIRQETFYLDTFNVSQEKLQTLTAEALRDGGSYCDLYFESTIYSSLLLRDGNVNSGGLHSDYGVGIRTLNGEKTGYAYSESTEWNDMVQAARAAAVIASTGGNPVATAPSSAARYHGRPNPAADRYPIVTKWGESPISTYAPFLKTIDKMVRESDDRIIKVIAMLSCQTTDVLMFNSSGELKYETRPMGCLSISAVFRQGDLIENKSVSKSLRAGAEMLTDDLAGELTASLSKGIDDRFAAKRPKGGEMCVVMGAGASGILLHEAMGHAFEADFNRKGQSIFSDKMGKQICRKGINIVDDGTIHGLRGSLNFDDEGVPAQRTCMVEDGILTSYLHDRISAGFYGVAPTGNGRRESFRYMPTPRMRATYMEAGEANPSDIIASVKKGIFVDEFANGQVKIGEGDFTFYVKSGYLIEDGHFTTPVKDINIVGNGPKALADIEMVGNDLKIDEGAWTCGKEQSVPVSCGIPTVLIKKLIVGGN